MKNVAATSQAIQGEGTAEGREGAEIDMVGGVPDAGGPCLASAGVPGAEGRSDLESTGCGRRPAGTGQGQGE